MKKRSIFGGLIIALFGIFVMPIVASADEYYKLSEFKGDGNILSSKIQGSEQLYYPTIGVETNWNSDTQTATETGRGILYLSNWFDRYDGVENYTSFSAKIKSTGLDESKKYNVIYKSKYEETNKTYTGKELNTGVVLEVKLPYKEAALSIIEDGTTNKVLYKYSSCDGAVDECNEEFATVKTFDEIGITFGNRAYFDSTELDAIFEEIAPDGKMLVNCVEPDSVEAAESMITASLPIYDDYELYGYMYEGQGYLYIQSVENYEVNKTYEVEYSFLEADENVIAILTELIGDKLSFSWEELEEDYDKIFVVEDLDSINYLYNVQSTINPVAAVNSIANYSSRLHNLTGNANVDFLFDVRAGGSMSMFTEPFIGPMNVVYDGVIYGNINPVGYRLNKIIYVPNDTAKTRDALIAAAKKRISEYLKGIDVDITYGGTIDELGEYEYSREVYIDDNVELVPLFDLEQTNGEWFIVTIGEEEYPYFIVIDSDKMSEPYLKTKDINTNIYVMTDSFDTPLDSRLSAIKLDPDSDEYKEIANKVKVIEGLAFDLNLYSTSLNMYIIKIAGGNFKVYIPIDEKLANKNLVATYVKADGNVENHPITVSKIDDVYYAVFETNHFSTYAITELTNPKTGDNYTSLIIMLIVGALGFVSARLLLKKRNN